MIRSLLLLLSLHVTATAQIVPAPQHAELGDAPVCRGELVRCDAPEFQFQVEAFVAALRKLGVAGARATVDADSAAVIIFLRKNSLPDDGYTISTEGDHLTVHAATTAGAAHAAASLLQTVSVENGQAAWPRMRVRDHAQYPYRSFLVDMGRNPHSPEILRQVVDMMWFYKGNYLQLHLSDDQLCSWPSKAFPKIYSARAGWTLADFAALEAYSQARGVTLIPELEVPGHSAILRREYPEAFGETTTDLATKPEAQAAVETLIAELLDVFQATPYMHIGGDEAYGVPQEIQREFINRLNRFTKSLGRRVIVWEGPHLGKGKNKVSEDVIHINWRTVDFPAQEMLDAGYEVVNASWDPLYVVDHYPRTMFTAVDVERCYRFDSQRFAHINHEFSSFKKPHRTRSAKGILGFCMPYWEGRAENLMPLCLHRFAAVASAAWNRPGEDDFAGYQERQERCLKILEQISGITLPETPFAEPESQRGNVAYKARVVPSSGASQPHFSPARLTNGIPDRFDHFLGFPTQPEPLEIVIELARPARVGRIVVYETAVGESHELYDLLVSTDGKAFKQVGSSVQGSRGDTNHVEHRFPARELTHIKILTHGCHGLTFPSFSRLTEVMAFDE